MYHSVYISVNNVLLNTWTDWKLIPTEPPFVAPPPFRSKYLDIPGMNGQLDISSALTGGPLYDNRKGSWTFYITGRPAASIPTLYSRIMNEIHGHMVSVALEDDPIYYYRGRLTVDSRKNDKSHSQITIGYVFEPMKYRNENEYPINGEGGWLWDPFNFDYDRIDTSTTPHTVVSSTFF